MSTHFCKQCGAPVRWVTSQKGRSFPIEESSDPQGTFLLEPGVDASGRKVLIAVGLDAREREVEAAKGTLLFRHHQAVCRQRFAAGSPPPPAVKHQAGQIIAQARRKDS